MIDVRKLGQSDATSLSRPAVQAAARSLLRDVRLAIPLVAARARRAPGQEQRLEPARRRRVLGERIRFFRPTEGAPRTELDARRAALARRERDVAEHAVFLDGATRLGGEDPYERVALHAVNEECVAVDRRAAERFARLGVQNTAHDDFGFAVTREIARRGVEDVLAVGDADRDERVARPVAKTFAENDEIAIVDEYALGATVARYVRHEIEARTRVAGTAVALVERVDAIEQLVRRGR